MQALKQNVRHLFLCHLEFSHVFPCLEHKDKGLWSKLAGFVIKHLCVLTFFSRVFLFFLVRAGVCRGAGVHAGHMLHH